MPTLNATQITAKWLTNYQGASTAMTQGAQAVTVAPGQLAAQAAALWLQRLQASQKKWSDHVGNVTLPEWQNAYVTLGIPRGQAGAQSKQGKYNTFITAYLQFLGNAVTTVKAMPKGTLAAGIARSNAMITASYNWGQTRA
jgi:hypothetical protein